MSQVKSQYPQATLFAKQRPQDPVTARYVDNFISLNNLSGSVFFATPSLSEREFYTGRTHLLATDILAGGYAVPRALSFGLAPLIHNVPGASELYPADYLWSKAEDILKRMGQSVLEDPISLITRLFNPELLANRVRGLLA
jgi:hypothetical protein